MFPALLLAASITTLAQHPFAAPADPEELSRAILARDEAVFDTMFNRCTPEAFADMVTPDIEFYHDKGGAMIGRDAFVADYARNCEARKAPDAWRSRRELVADSTRINPVPGFGAVEEGRHLFYERQGDGPERLTGRARFVILWKLTDGEWRMARVFSIDHSAIE